LKDILLLFDASSRFPLHLFDAALCIVDEGVSCLLCLLDKAGSLLLRRFDSLPLKSVTDFLNLFVGCRWMLHIPKDFSRFSLKEQLAQKGSVGVGSAYMKKSIACLIVALSVATQSHGDYIALSNVAEDKNVGGKASQAEDDATIVSMLGWGVGLAAVIAIVSAVVHQSAGPEDSSSSGS
jgi:hypothetical protein